VAAYRAALVERTREVVPIDCAYPETGLGAALASLGERVSGLVMRVEAVAALVGALEEQTLERVPLGWASTTGSQGATLRVLAERTGDTAMARRARDQIALAAAALRGGGHAHYAAYSAGQLPAAEALVARLAARGT
jgi:hypothetical protein